MANSRYTTLSTYAHMVRALTKNALFRTCFGKPYDWIKLSQKIKLIDLVKGLPRSFFALFFILRYKQKGVIAGATFVSLDACFVYISKWTQR